MGIMICPEHGRQQNQFASPRLARQAECGDLTAEDIHLLKIKWCEIWWTCPVYADFLDENALDVPSSGTIVIEDEGKAEELMSKLLPCCEACLLACLKDKEKRLSNRS